MICICVRLGAPLRKIPPFPIPRPTFFFRDKNINVDGRFGNGTVFLSITTVLVQ